MITLSLLTLPCVAGRRAQKSIALVDVHEATWAMLAIRGARWRRGAAPSTPRAPNRCQQALPAGVGKPTSPIAKKQRPSVSRQSSPLAASAFSVDGHDEKGASTEAAPVACQASQIRECIRSLVSMVRRKSTGDLAVDAHRLASIKTVVRLLSMSEDDLKALPEEQRKQVNGIRNNALSKMQLAQKKRMQLPPKKRSCCAEKSPSSPPCSPPSSPPSSPQAPRVERSPQLMPPPAFYMRKTYFGVRCEA